VTNPLPQFTAEGREKARQTRKIAKDPAELLKKARLPVSSENKARILARLKEMPAIYRFGYIKAKKGKSIAAAVRAQCLECVCWQKEEVRLCSSPACPLFQYRPFQ